MDHQSNTLEGRRASFVREVHLSAVLDHQQSEQESKGIRYVNNLWFICGGRIGPLTNFISAASGPQ